MGTVAKVMSEKTPVMLDQCNGMPQVYILTF